MKGSLCLRIYSLLTLISSPPQFPCLLSFLCVRFINLFKHFLPEGIFHQGAMARDHKCITQHIQNTLKHVQNTMHWNTIMAG